MGSVDRGDDWTFEANFTVDGVLKLKERVNEKLKELMGDYTDDHFVDYVIMLLRNGRHKEQARNELKVFLGDNSDSFVSWLWDHLTLNIDLYVQPKELPDDTPKRIISEVQSAGGGDDNQHLNSKSERRSHNKLYRSRRNKGWKGLGRGEAEPPTLRSSEVFEEKVENGRPRPPSSPAVCRKRGHPYKPKTESDTVSQVTTNAPSRRLLQFAVRDAVAASRPSVLTPPVDPCEKRLRYLCFHPWMTKNKFSKYC